MARLVDDLLDVGRVMTGKIVLDRRVLDLADCVRACLFALGPSERVEERIEVTTEPVWVRADAVRMDQIVGNLVTNALKFTPHDRPVRVRVRAEGSEAVLQVEDEGAGIDADILPHVFDLFVQADDTFDRLKGGLGIGLTLVRRLVELHGGTVQASSSGPDLGSTFTVRFPAVASPDEVSAEAAPSRTERPCKRVLLVDDHADSRAMYSLVLRADGHDVYEAEDGPGAVTMFGSTRPDVAIVDIGLPTMNGYELARWIRSQPDGADVTLIALTGYGFPEDRERSRAAGFDRHMVKPASPADLRREVDECAQRVRRE
jgi:CheY-like chemotaxis protein